MTSQEILNEYVKAKAAHPQVLLLFKKGDYYTFCQEDAEVAGKILQLTVCRGKGAENHVLTVGFPAYMLEECMNKLKKLGYRVAMM